MPELKTEFDRAGLLFCCAAQRMLRTDKSALRGDRGFMLDSFSLIREADGQWGLWNGELLARRHTYKDAIFDGFRAWTNRNLEAASKRFFEDLRCAGTVDQGHADAEKF